AELDPNGPGDRQFNVVINGGQVLNNFDVVGTAGHNFTAVRQTIQAVADATGTIRIRFLAGTDEAIINGIEVSQAGSLPPIPEVPQTPVEQAATAGSSASFTATALGNPGPSVQWQVSTDFGKTFSNIPNDSTNNNTATSPTLTLSSVTAAQNGTRY